MVIEGDDSGIVKYGIVKHNEKLLIITAISLCYNKYVVYQLIR